MKILNSDGIPSAVYELISNDEYSKGDADLSVTELIDSPRVRVLTKRHDHEIEVEASTMLALTLGKAFHKAVEMGTKSGIPERRLSAEVLGWKISGGMDHYDNGVVTDYKTANVYKTVYSDCGHIDEWENQLNTYSFILRENSIAVNKAKIFVLFKDWNRRGYGEAKKKGKLWEPNQQAGYPEKHWEYFDIPLWSPRDAQAYVLGRIQLHQLAERELPFCTSSEIWKGSRCTTYCNVSKWCDQYKNAQKTGLSQSEG